jgi:peptide/nickel transport system permease protein
MVGLGIVVALIALAVLAPVLAPYDPAVQHRLGLTIDGQPLSPGEDGFILGTDSLGRDELSRLLDGARVSLVVGIGANLLAAVIGVLLGGMAAIVGRRQQTLLMRLVDIVLSFPILLLAIALLAVTQPSIRTITLIIGASFGAYLSRLVYAQATSLRQREFVLAAESAGVTRVVVLFRHLLPHVLPSIIVFCTLGVAVAIQLEAALSYVGIGIQQPQASWGNMIAEGQVVLTSSPWLVILPGLMIVLAMVGFSLLGDGLRDALDPTLERRVRVRGLR